MSGRKINNQEVTKSEMIKRSGFRIFLFLNNKKMNMKVNRAGNPQRTPSCQIGVRAFTKSTPLAMFSKLKIKGRANVRPESKIPPTKITAEIIFSRENFLVLNLNKRTEIPVRRR